MLLVLLALLLFSAVAGAGQSLPFTLAAPFEPVQPLALNASDRQWLDLRKALRVGIVVADNEPIDITTDGNRYQGVSADYLSLLAGKLNMPVQLKGFSQRDDAIDALRDGSIDLLSSASCFERGQAGLAFSRAYMPDRAVVVGHRSALPPAQGLAGKKIVVLDDYADPQALQRLYPDSQIILAPGLYSAMEALRQQEVDVLIGNDVVVRSYLSMRPYLALQVHFESALAPHGFAFALRADGRRLKGLVDQALASLDVHLEREVQARWTAGLNAYLGEQRIALSSLERSWLARHPRITVATTEHPPYIYRDEQGRWVGLNADVLARISRMTGLQFVHQSMPSTLASLDALNRGEAELNTTLAENPERKVFLNFTYSFGGNNWVFVVRRGDASPASLAQLGDRILALPARHALESEIRQNYPNIQLRLVETYAQARELVEKGQAHVTIQNEAGAYLFSSEKLKVGRSVDGKWSPDRFAVARSHPELLSILNKALEAFPVSEMRTIRTKWLSASLPQPSLWSRIPQWLVWSVVLTLLLGLVLLACNSRLRIQAAQRRQVEAQLNDQLAFKQALFDAMPMPVYVRDLQGRLVSCNRSYEQFFEIGVEHMQGRRLIDIELLPRQLAERMHADYLQLLESRQPVFVERTFELNGRRVDAWQWSVPFYAADGRLQGLLGGWVDISDRKHLERELEQLRRQYEQHTGHAQQRPGQACACDPVAGRC
ncbi:sensory box histidine kinase/response regulator [Pseudomonas sp. StFLB209]|nr:sensory box histidine kinase/response regulator [Pseudomonas sp. StFLB209]